MSRQVCCTETPASQSRSERDYQPRWLIWVILFLVLPVAPGPWLLGFGIDFLVNPEDPYTATGAVFIGLWLLAFGAFMAGTVLAWLRKREHR